MKNSILMLEELPSFPTLQVDDFRQAVDRVTGIDESFLGQERALTRAEVQVREQMAYQQAQLAEQTLLVRQEELNAIQAQRAGLLRQAQPQYINQDFGRLAGMAMSSCAMVWNPMGMIGLGEGETLAPPPIQDSQLPHGKAHALLLEHIGEGDYIEFMRSGWIHYQHKRDWYVFMDGRVTVVDGNQAKSLCIQLAERCPVMDKVLALKLALEENEEDVLAKANVLNVHSKEDFMKTLN